MFDVKTKALLEILRDLCPDDRYEVVSVEDINGKAEEGVRFSPDETDGLLTALSEAGMISVRFSDGKEYCLTVLPKGRQSEPFPVKYANNARYRPFFVLFAASFIGAFAGAFLAGMLR